MAPIMSIKRPALTLLLLAVMFVGPVAAQNVLHFRSASKKPTTSTTHANKHRLRSKGGARGRRTDYHATCEPKCEDGYVSSLSNAPAVVVFYSSCA